MVNPQEWLESQEQYNTKEKREKIIDLDVGFKGLFGELDLSDFVNLEKLNCMGNWLTKLILPVNINNIRELYLSHNMLTGSLDFLSNMKNLKVLSIGDNDFNEVNIDKLPRSLEYIDYYAKRENCKLTEIISKLEEVKHGFCQKCQKPNTSTRWCQPCANKEWEQDLKKLSGQEIIKKLIQKLGKDAWGNYKLKWIPHEWFTDIEYLAEGGFGKVYRAKWKEIEQRFYHNMCNDIALKSLHNSQNISLEFLTELANTILINDCNIAIHIVKCWGVSQDPVTRNYVIVMDHIKGGNFREYLQQNSKKLDLKIKLKKLFDIAIGLNFVHEQSLVHKDLHAGNVLNDEYGGGDGDGYDRSFVSDFGFSYPVNLPKKEGQIYGVPAYIAPEVLQGYSYTQTSDIYSFGIVAYELLASSYPYYEKRALSGEELITKICLGLRPNIDELKIPQLLKDLIKRCWNADLQERPTTHELYENISNWLGEINNKKYTPFYQQYQTLEEEYNYLSKTTIYRIHPTATVTSIPIDTKEVTQLLQNFINKIPKN